MNPNFYYGYAPVYDPERERLFQKAQQKKRMRSLCSKMGLFAIVYMLSMYTVIIMLTVLVKIGIKCGFCTS